MDRNKRRTIEGWVDKAWNQLYAAKEHLKSSVRYSESIEASQECVELSVKSILSLLGINYSLSHEWKRKEFSKIAEQIQKRGLMDKLKEQNLGYTICLPRLLFLVNFWAQFYLIAKYGFEIGYLASARDLFNKEEAEIALRHAEECYSAASRLKNIGEKELSTIVLQP